MPYRVALLVPEFHVAGGVTGVGLFLRDVLKDTERYTPDVISLAQGAWDPAGSQLARPSTWTRGVQVEERTWDGIPYRHVGARWSEFEFQRYRPRPVLTNLLREYDLVQIVAGTPVWGHVSKYVNVPVALQVATLTKVERNGQAGDTSPLRRVWSAGMTQVVAQMEARVPPLVDAIFVENTWMYEHYREEAGDEIVHFAPPGIDTTVFHPAQRADRRGNYILSVGRLGDTRKNVSLLFRAYHRLTQSETDVPKLILAGLSSPPSHAWRLAQELGIRDRIEMHENVPKDELARLYRHARLFVLSSNEEGLGLVLAEAMASGTPVVSTDCGGPSTLIEEEKSGFLVPIGDEESLADRMGLLLSDPEKGQSMGREGRRRIEEEFSVEAAGERFLRVYDQLLS
jgi:glycosyltransferase involved in cell wall biosynthesis